MGQKQQRVVVTFHTTAAVMQLDRSSKANGLGGKIISVPRQLSPGCGLAWSEVPSNRELLERVIQEQHIEIDEMHLMDI